MLQMHGGNNDHGIIFHNPGTTLDLALLVTDQCLL